MLICLIIMRVIWVYTMMEGFGSSIALNLEGFFLALNFTHNQFNIIKTYHPPCHFCTSCGASIHRVSFAIDADNGDAVVRELKAESLEYACVPSPKGGGERETKGGWRRGGRRGGMMGVKERGEN